MNSDSLMLVVQVGTFIVSTLILLYLVRLTRKVNRLDRLFRRKEQ